MKEDSLPDLEGQVLQCLGALGEGTRGDLVGLLGRPRVELDAALETLIAMGRAEVRVSDSGDMVYRLTGGVRSSGGRVPPAVRFDRKTLHLIRTLDGVISVAELVEHTGTSVAEARRELRRLAAWYGGEPHRSLDGHIVHAFPLVMTSVHPRSKNRAPRPAWIRLGDPMGSRRLTQGGGWIGRVAYSVGLLGFARRILRHVRPFRALRRRRRSVLRRLALGHVFETALAGRGVVSVESTRRYLASRSGGSRVGRARVEAVLHDLADEFEALVTREGDELFFGFRNVKRQFLAAEVVRRELALGRRVTGPTVFDSGDTREIAAARDLEAFDRELRASLPGPDAARDAAEGPQR